MTSSDDLDRLLNATGYAFQLAVERLVEQSRADFKVVTREHPWQHPTRERSGFVDLIIEKHMVRFVIECKRSKEGLWLFLVPDGESRDELRFDCYWRCQLEAEKEAADWSGVHLKPGSPLSQFCCVRGHGEGQVALLDRIGSELICATEALAIQESSLDPRFKYEATIYFPVIVTNADLYVANFDPGSVTLRSGRVDLGEHTEVGVVRYRKALGPNPRQSEKAQSLRDWNSDSQRSVWVVNVASFAEFLGNVDFVGGPIFPWVLAKESYLMRKRREGS